MDQYKTFVSLVPEIERVLESKGIQVPRPQYDKSKDEPMEDGDGSEEEETHPKKRNGKASKPNHEATSDEDEE